MRIITNLSEANSILKKYSGSILNVAFYSESLRRIAIRLTMSNNEEIVYLILFGCESMQGMFYYLEASILIKEEILNEVLLTNVIDISSNFILTANGGFSLYVGRHSEFGKSFENFFISELKK